MIIKTRYRDIPWEELMACGHADTEYDRSRWPKSRGTAIYIRIPAENREVTYRCSQPRYVVCDKDGVEIVNQRGVRVSVCPHIAELGD